MTALICEVYEEKLEPLYEEVNGKKTLFIEGVFLQAGLKNRNGRIYPPDLMEREVNSYTNSHITTQRAWGELNHPPTPTINLDRVSHRCVGLRQEGNNWVGKAMILETPMGVIARQLIENGSIGTSSRGLGSLRKRNDGIMEVQSDFRLMVAGDIVSDPSAPDAFVKGLMEGVRYYDSTTDSWQLEEELESITKDLKHIPKALLGEAAVSAWDRFLQKLAVT
jgi:hypothetical protein